MDAPSAAQVAGLCAVAGCGGFVDAIAGGGGLLTLPALLGVFPADAHFALGTNKAQSSFGSGAALLTYLRAGLVDRDRAPATFGFALAGSLAGALTVQRISAAALRPIVVGLLATVAVLLLARPQLGADALDPARVPKGARAAWRTAALASGVGFYDGFFGPGTGTFAIIGFALALGQPLVRGTGNAKVVNFASNLAALGAFALAGRVVWTVAIPMAAAQMVGAAAGARTTALRGSPLVRKVVVAVALAVCARLGWDWLR